MPKVTFFIDSGCCPKILDYTLFHYKILACHLQPSNMQIMFFIIFGKRVERLHGAETFNTLKEQKD